MVADALFVRPHGDCVSPLTRANAYSHVDLSEGLSGDRILAIATGRSKWSLPVVNGPVAYERVPDIFAVFYTTHPRLC